LATAFGAGTTTGGFFDLASFTGGACFLLFGSSLGAAVLETFTWGFAAGFLEEDLDADME
jgi:hypothetical protein